MASPHVINKTRPTSPYNAPLFSPSTPWCYEPFIYRIFYGSNNVDQPIVHEVCAERGWIEYGEEQKKLTCGGMLGWNLWWRCTTLSVNPLRTLYSWQYTNQIPKAIGFTNKEYLRHYFKFLHKEFGNISDFGPLTFILPNEWNELKTENATRIKFGSRPYMSEDPTKSIRNIVEYVENDQSTRIPLWITKPVGKSQGKGITVIDNIENLEHVQTTTVVQEYIARPLLIGGYKFDLRIYVCVTSTNPLTVYVYREGLTRFATQKYNLTDLSNSFSHLTNTSVNKHSEDYMRDKEHIGLGCKWSLAKLRRYFATNKIPDFYLWQRIWSIILITIVGEANRITSIPFTRNCFSFLGYDILIDESLRPYLLEVNLAPALNADTDVDTKVKKPMLHDLFNLIGLPRKKVQPRKNPNPYSIPIYGRPGSSSSIPASYYRSDTVEKALSLVPPGKQHKFVPGTKLRQRLIDMTAIYTQDLSGQLKKILKKQEQARPKLKGQPKQPPPADCPYIDPKSCPRSPESPDAKKKRNTYDPLARSLTRNWTDPLGHSGDWFRVFPYDSVSHDQSRNQKKREMNLKTVMSGLFDYLDNVRKVVLEKPWKSDEFYVEELKKMSKIDTDIWFPPIDPEDEAEDPDDDNDFESDTKVKPGPMADTNAETFNLESYCGRRERQ